MTEDRPCHAGEDRVSEIEQRAARATDGPWFFGPLFKDMAGDLMVWKLTKKSKRDFIGSVGGLMQPVLPPGEADILFQAERDNAEFIAHARDDVPYLLDQLAEAQQQLAESKAAHEVIQALCEKADAAIAEAAELRRLVLDAEEVYRGLVDLMLIPEGCNREALERAEQCQATLANTNLAAEHLAKDKQMQGEVDRLREALEYIEVATVQQRLVCYVCNDVWDLVDERLRGDDAALAERGKP